MKLFTANKDRKIILDALVETIYGISVLEIEQLKGIRKEKAFKIIKDISKTHIVKSISGEQSDKYSELFSIEEG